MLPAGELSSYLHIYLITTQTDSHNKGKKGESESQKEPSLDINEKKEIIFNVCIVSIKRREKGR